MHQFYSFLEQSWIGHMVRSIPDMFPVCEFLHFVGLSMLLGALLVVDLRVIGVIRNVAYGAVLNLVWVAIAGFANYIQKNSSSHLTFEQRPAWRDRE